MRPGLHCNRYYVAPIWGRLLAFRIAASAIAGLIRCSAAPHCRAESPAVLVRTRLMPGTWLRVPPVRAASWA